MSNDLVSIITPSYNTSKFILNTIESVVAQTYTYWEMIIVDDCSTDNSVDIIKEYIKNYNEKRIKLYINKEKSGAAVSRNFALRKANGHWVAFIDSDDIWLPEKLEKQIYFMESNDYNFSYTNYIEIDVNGKDNGVCVSGPKIITKRAMFNYCWPGCLTVMYNKSKVGFFQIKDIKKNNDYAMWLKICKNNNCYLLNETLAKYRRGRIGSVSTHSVMVMIKWHYLLFRKVENKEIALAIFYTAKNIMFGAIKKILYVKRKY